MPDVGAEWWCLPRGTQWALSVEGSARLHCSPPAAGIGNDAVEADVDSTPQPPPGPSASTPTLTPSLVSSGLLAQSPSSPRVSSPSRPPPPAPTATTRPLRKHPNLDAHAAEPSTKKRKEGQRCKRKQDEVEAGYERQRFSASAEEPTPPPAVGEKRKAPDEAVAAVGAGEEDEAFDDESKPLRTVFVGNLPLRTKRKALTKEFAAFSEVESVRIRSVPLADDPGPYTGDGSVDIEGTPASRQHTGKWRACYSILGGEFCGAMGYYGVGTNLVSYLTKVQHQSNVTAASNIASWQGTCYLTPLLGAFLADSYWGKHRTIVISLTIFTFGMVLLILSVVVPANIHSVLISPQAALSSLGLYMTALGLGGIWPCVPTFGADQFDDTDEAEKAQKELYYNWYYFAVNGGFFLASTVIVWIQDNCGWGWGFGIPTLFSAIGIAGFLASMKTYRYQKPGGSALTRICQVVIAAIRKMDVDVPTDSSLLYETPGKESAIVGSRKLMHTDGLRFFDRAAAVSAYDETSGNLPSPWRLCTVTQVEELKIMVRMLPVLLTAIIFNTAEACFPLFIEQGSVMDNHIDAFALPPASLTTFNCVCILILAPTYDKVLMPMVSRITGMKRGLSELHRIGVGMVFAMFSLVSAALVEMVRLNIAKNRGLVHQNTEVPMNILWQAPQYFLLGVAKVFSVVGFIEFAYEQSPDAMRSLCQACSLIMVTLGSYLVSVMLKIISSVTVGRGNHGWIPENLNEGHLDQFFWLMAGLHLLNLLTFLYCATRYKHKLAT